MLKMNDPNNQIISYHRLRMFIGMIGAGLPLVLFLGRFLTGGWSNVENSISDFYYTEYRNLLVGVLFVLGTFLLTYRGKDKYENWFANTGFAFAIGVAIFPCQHSLIAIQVLHFISAGLLFAMFATFSLWLFRRSIKKDLDKPVFRRINRVYLCTGYLLIISIILMIVSVIFGSEQLHNTFKPVFWFETLGLFSFAVAWFTRAHFIWRDKSEYPDRLYMFR